MLITIRPARTDEADLLTEIACRAKAYWGYGDDQIAKWKPAFLTITSDYIREHSVCVAEYTAGKPVAFAALEHRHWRAVLEHLWVLPEYIGRGIGTQLFHHIAGRVSVFTLTSDPHADGFYLQLGAQLVGEVESDYQGRRLSLFLYDAAAVNRSE